MIKFHRIMWTNYTHLVKRNWIVLKSSLKGIQLALKSSFLFFFFQLRLVRQTIIIGSGRRTDRRYDKQSCLARTWNRKWSTRVSKHVKQNAAVWLTTSRWSRRSLIHFARRSLIAMAFITTALRVRLIYLNFFLTSRSIKFHNLSI